MMKQILQASLGAMQAVAPAQAITTSAPFIAPKEDPDGQIPIEYSLPSELGKYTWESYILGIKTDTEPVVSGTWIDYNFMGVPSKTTSNFDLRLDEHYVAIRPTGLATDTINIYPHDDSQLTTSHLNLLSNLPGAGTNINQWFGSAKNLPLNYNIDSATGAYWFGGDTLYGQTYTNPEQYSNELTLLTLTGQAQPFEAKIVDLFELHDATGVHDIRFDTKFYFNPVTKNVGTDVANVNSKSMTIQATSKINATSGIDTNTLFND